MSEAQPQKRPAFEPAARLDAPLPPDPAMHRPVSTTAGAVLVLLRAVAGVVWLAAFALGWGGWWESLAASFGGDASDGTDSASAGEPAVLAVVAIVVGVGVLLEAVLGVLILAGRNGARVVVMILSVLSISSAFAGWWAEGQQIRISTTFVTLTLDVLILLALSSRSSAAYARRRERRPDSPRTSATS